MLSAINDFEKIMELQQVEKCLRVQKSNKFSRMMLKEITDITLSYWDNAVVTNLRGHFLMTREVVPHMKSAGKGSIVIISSVHTWLTQPGCSVYAATKGGIVSMTRSMALELAPYGIRVNAVLPGLSRSKAMPVDGGETIHL